MEAGGSTWKNVPTRAQQVKPHTCQCLRWVAIAPPYRAVGAIKRIVVFAWLCGPGANACFSSADFDGAMLLAAQRRLPIEAIAADISERAAGIAIVLEGIECSARVILRMTARGHTPIALIGGDASIIQLLISDDVVSYILIV